MSPLSKDDKNQLGILMQFIDDSKLTYVSSITIINSFTLAFSKTE